MNATEALFGFMGWLTCRERAVTFSARHEAGPAVELISRWMEANGLPDVTDAYPNNITHPKEADAAQEAEAGTPDLDGMRWRALVEAYRETRGVDASSAIYAIEARVKTSLSTGD